MNVAPTELSDELLVAPEIVDRRPFDPETAERRRRIVHGRPQHVDWGQFCNFVAGRWRTSGWPYLGPQAGILEWMTQAHAPLSIPLGQAMATLGGAGFDEGHRHLGLAVLANAQDVSSTETEATDDNTQQALSARTTTQDQPAKTTSQDMIPVSCPGRENSTVPRVDP
ncbi:MAG: hypothetical protein QG597_379 [Actinomycetota bacterium]|nr:hypothetical protein [Actinomycetota bacterium]